VQIFAARIITDTKKYGRITPALGQLDWLPVRQMLSLRDAAVIFKCLKGLAPPYLSERFIKRSEAQRRNTRNRNMLQIPMRYSSTGQHSFLYRAVSLWNNLPESIRCTDSLAGFKLALKEHFKKNKYSAVLYIFTFLFIDVCN